MSSRAWFASPARLVSRRCSTSPTNPRPDGAILRSGTAFALSRIASNPLKTLLRSKSRSLNIRAQWSLTSRAIEHNRNFSRAVWYEREFEYLSEQRRTAENKGGPAFTQWVAVRSGSAHHDSTSAAALSRRNLYTPRGCDSAMAGTARLISFDED